MFSIVFFLSWKAFIVFQFESCSNVSCPLVP
uniref:Uncharacterized protein n=1 Tax=Arundo donax TaxID=35708 RepID=A0A0A9I3J5_ARUDO